VTMGAPVGTLTGTFVLGKDWLETVGEERGREKGGFGKKRRTSCGIPPGSAGATAAAARGQEGGRGNSQEHKGKIRSGRDRMSKIAKKKPRVKGRKKGAGREGR